MASKSPDTKAKNPFFNDGNMYEKLVGGTASRLAAAALSHLPLSTYTSTSRILDSACGPGTATKILLSPSAAPSSVRGLPIDPPPRVTGIDLAEPMIEQYRANASALGWATAESYVQDSQDLSRFPDATFDAVVMSLGIFALADATAGAREMLRVLKPGGHAVVTTWKTRRPRAIMGLALEAVRPGSDVPDLDPKWSTSEHLAAVMEGGGFRVENTRLYEEAPNWALGSLDGLLEGLRSPFWTAAYCKGWSEGEMSRWKEEMEKQLTEKERATGTLEMVAHVCVARKDA
ncbi:S-adenosyl-L-methionine-dependent methyltransferase [Xylaria intraflava]|nr:S-adenosyl-L-methionine-dependent methyltransferase [Xylaria intraflava]